MIAAALIEDYFFVNEVDTDVYPRNSAMALLVEPFCITEPGVLIFNLAVNYSSEDNNTITPNVKTDLLIDGVIVASSRVNDGQEPSNVALFYEAVVEGTEEVQV